MKKLTIVDSDRVSTPAIEPVACVTCGERITYGIEVVIAPVRRKGSRKWLRKHSARGLICLACFRDGKSEISAE